MAKLNCTRRALDTATLPVPNGDAAILTAWGEYLAAVRAYDSCECEDDGACEHALRHGAAHKTIERLDHPTTTRGVATMLRYALSWTIHASNRAWINGLSLRDGDHLASLYRSHRKALREAEPQFASALIGLELMMDRAMDDVIEIEQLAAAWREKHAAFIAFHDNVFQKNPADRALYDRQQAMSEEADALLLRACKYPVTTIAGLNAKVDLFLEGFGEDGIEKFDALTLIADIRRIAGEKAQ